jgi:hypothetical protein
MKRFLIFIDRKLLGSQLARLRGRLISSFKVLIFSKGFDFQMKIFYHKKETSLLTNLCDQFGSDKGGSDMKKSHLTWANHTYVDYYEQLFGHCRESVLNIFECGIGTNHTDQESSMGSQGIPGASLRVWREYFPNAQIYGADIDERILFEESRIKTFQMDQCSPLSIKSVMDSFPDHFFDFMIDDGLHTFDAGRVLFENSISKLKVGGIYCIEDVEVVNLDMFKHYFDITGLNTQYLNLMRPRVDLLDNSLIIVRK